MTPVRFELPSKKRAWLDIAPLIDLVFLLLIFFLVGSRFVKPQMELTLPKAFTGQNQSQPTAILSVSSKQEVFLNETKIPIENLDEALPLAIQNLNTNELTLRADKDTPFFLFVQLMDAARKAGIPELHIEHEVKH